MSQYKRATWKKGDETMTGEWRWSYFLQRFQIYLDEPDPVTGRKRIIETSGDEPGFNGWKLVKEANEVLAIIERGEA